MASTTELIWEPIDWLYVGATKPTHVVYEDKANGGRRIVKARTADGRLFEATGRGTDMLEVTTTIEGVDLDAPSVDNAIIRAELHLVMDTSLGETDGDRKAYLLGMYLGYSVALGMLGPDVLDEARRYPRAACLSLDDALKPIGVAHESQPRLRACGIRWGFKEASRFRQDADECASCSERLLASDDTEFCARDCQTFCGWNFCRDDWHGAGRCSECDDV